MKCVNIDDFVLFGETWVIKNDKNKMLEESERIKKLETIPLPKIKEDREKCPFDFVEKQFDDIFVVSVLKEKQQLKGNSLYQYVCYCSCNPQRLFIRNRNFFLSNTNKKCELCRFRPETDYTGLVKDNFKVLGYINILGEKRHWLCKCLKCGNYFLTHTGDINRNKMKSCGCMMKNGEAAKRKALKVGDISNKWEILEVVDQNDKNPIFKVKCTCGCNETRLIAKKSLNATLCNKRIDIDKKRIEEFRKNPIPKSAIPKNVKNLTGKIFGKLKVIGYAGKFFTEQYWIVQCSCELHTILVVSRSNLEGKEYFKDCGCGKFDKIIEENKDLIEKRRGRLVGKELVKYYEGRKVVRLRCECDCGGEIYLRPKLFRDGWIKSCGCMISAGEDKIKNFLEEYKIKFEQQKFFKECKNISALRFDFQIFYPNSNNFFMVEYQGKQHYIPVSFDKKLSEKEIIDIFKENQLRDDIKRQYCKDNNIELLEIPYWDFDNIEKILADKLGIKLSEEELNETTE